MHCPGGKWLTYLTLIAATANVGITRVYGQGMNMVSPSKKTKTAASQSADAQAGLDSATPTDSIEEVGNGAGAAGDNAGAIDNFPAANSLPSTDLSGGGSTEGDSLFDDGARGTDKGGATGTSNTISAFGADPVNAKVAPPAATKVPKLNRPADAIAPKPPLGSVTPATLPTKIPTVNPTIPLHPTATVQPAPKPVPPVPANVSTPSNLGGPDTGQSATLTPAASTPATGQESLTSAAPAAAAIKAPQLPLPNEFSGAPPVPGTLRLMAEGEAPEEYKVEPGDTLYDICDQLLDEGGYWPKLWALNPDIKNPHFIFPNMRLKFYPGDDETPPYLQVVAEDDVIPIDKGDLNEEDLIAEKVVYPGEHAFEDSASEVIGPAQVDELTDAVLVGGNIFHGTEMAVHVPGFIYAQEKAALGFIVGGREGNISLGPTARALVESVDSLAAGTLYTVLRPAGSVKNPETGDQVGYRYYFVANVRLDHAIKDTLFLGAVQDSILGVMPNDMVVSYISTRRVVPMSTAVGSLNRAEANVVAFDHFDQEVGGQGHYAFIDKGSGGGVAVGMYLPIYSTPGNLSLAFGSADLPIDYELAGYMRIVDATDAGAVGYIVRNKYEIRLGDRTYKE